MCPSFLFCCCCCFVIVVVTVCAYSPVLIFFLVFSSPYSSSFPFNKKKEKKQSTKEGVHKKTRTKKELYRITWRLILCIRVFTLLHPRKKKEYEGKRVAVKQCCSMYSDHTFTDRHRSECSRPAADCRHPPRVVPALSGNALPCGASTRPAPWPDAASRSCGNAPRT